MDSRLAEVSLLISGRDSVQLTRTPFKYSPDQSKPFNAEDAKSEIGNTSGWIGLKTAPFDDWEKVHAIDLSYPNGRNSSHVLEVNRLLKAAVQHGDWLWFPVKTLHVSVYRDKD